MNKKCSSAYFAAITALPVILAQLCLFPFWLMHIYASGALPMASLLLTGLLTPAYLAVRACQLILSRFAIHASFGFGIVLVVFVLSFVLDYSSWGISSRQFWSPDDGTVEIEHVMALVATVILLLPVLVVYAVRYTSGHLNHTA